MGRARLRSRGVRVGAYLLVAQLWLGACEFAEPVPGPAPPQDPTSPQVQSCERLSRGAGPPQDLQETGRGLSGDVDGDDRPDRVTLRESDRRPEACRRTVVVETATGELLWAPIKSLEWPSSEPELFLLAEIDGRPGLEPVVALSPGAVFRPGAVFTVVDGELVRMRLDGEGSGSLPDLFPFFDEFPTGVDCTDKTGEIVVTVSEFAPRGDDSVFGITRTFYRADGAIFRRIGREESLVDCCNGEAKQRWPETADDPFRSCSGRVR